VFPPIAYARRKRIFLPGSGVFREPASRPKRARCAGRRPFRLK